MKESYCFGIDGGGTHSRLALINGKGEILARTEAGSTNIYSVKKEEVYENLFALLDLALKESGLKKGDLTAGCIGSAGLGREGEKKLFREFCDRLLGPETPVKLCSDGEILLCGGLGSLEGYCLIAGTGSVALGRSADGKLVRAGGLGYMLGDEGAAAWIGKTAIARSLRSLEKRDLPTSMMPAILEACKLEQGSDLIQYVHLSADKAKIAALAPVVTVAARKGDALALDILQTGAAELVLLVRSVLEQSPRIKNQALVLAGGAIEHDEILRGNLEKSLSKEFPRLSVGNPRGSALEGACMLALALKNQQ
ncbi:N-acetylmuramic acid/N-acetylglucosamine kinase [Spirochaetia bacterium]|nr:N-acetylmuramic acid/N-acetylglucosamine kinase [Spirochaetia bacterium]